jgi:hypothetical protein
MWLYQYLVQIIGILLISSVFHLHDKHRHSNRCKNFALLPLILQYVDEQIRTPRSLRHSNLATLTDTNSLFNNN